MPNTVEDRMLWWNTMSMENRRAALEDASRVLGRPANVGDAWMLFNKLKPSRDPKLELLTVITGLLEGCVAVLDEAKSRADYLHDTWNPDAHIELTLTIGEIRKIHAAVARARE